MVEAMTDLKWYVVHAYSGFEQKAKAALIERARMRGLTAKVGDIIIPETIKEQVTKSGKKKSVARTAYPGYLLVQLALDDETMFLVQETPKITGFVGNARHPRPLSEQEVLRLTRPEEYAEQTPAVVTVSFEKGESVKVTDGPFSNFDGIIDDVRPDKQKVRVLVSIFGRETPVELDYNQVEKRA